MCTYPYFVDHDTLVFAKLSPDEKDAVRMPQLLRETQPSDPAAKVVIEFTVGNLDYRKMSTSPTDKDGKKHPKARALRLAGVDGALR
jgi:hypothetical protein